jgi:anti-anti-sigma factor
MIEIHKFHDVNVIDVEGELSRYNVNDLERVLDSLSRCAQHNVVLGFDRLKHLDYKLVRRIADRIIEFQCDGGDLKLAGASKYIRDILEAMGLEEEMYPSVQDALLSFLTMTDSEVWQ